jgi:cytochrome c oxidase subunit II
MNREFWVGRGAATRFLAMLAAVVMAAGMMMVSVRHTSAAQESVQEIEVSAKRFEFTPSEIHVKQGAQVRLKVTATDREHGFEVQVFPESSDKTGDPGLKFSVAKPSFKLPENETQTIEFTALQPGTYDFKCVVYCGSGHHGMKGTIVVEP